MAGACKHYCRPRETPLFAQSPLRDLDKDARVWSEDKDLGPPGRRRGNVILSRGILDAAAQVSQAAASARSSSSIMPSMTLSPFCQNSGCEASRPNGAKSSEWCL